MLLKLIILMALTTLAIALLMRWRLPAILGYLTAGIALRELGYDLFEAGAQLKLLTELGLVFLLFTLGLEFSFPQLKSLQRAVFAFGPSQFFGTALICFLPLAFFLNFSITQAVVIAFALAMSSTALVSKQLREQRELNTRHGRNAIGVLLFQDLVAVPLLILVPALAAPVDGNLAQNLLMAFAKGITAAIVLVFAGRKVLPPLFHWVAKKGSDELFVLVCLLVTLVAAEVTETLGLSMALGAFLAGTLLGESQHKHQIEAEIRPFRDVLLGLFFISIGNLLSLAALVEHAEKIAIALPLIIAAKAGVIYVSLMILKERQREAVLSSLVLAQVGEFGFALFALAADHRLLTDETLAVVLATSIASMLLAPLILRHSTNIADFLLRRKHRLEDDVKPVTIIEAATGELEDHIVICGFGRVGQLVYRFTEWEGFQNIALDRDSQRVQEASQAGVNVFFGDASRKEILRAAGVERARMVVVCVDNIEHAEQIVSATRALREDVPVMVRTRDDHHLDELREGGATEVVPEILEGSLMLISHVLVMLEVPVSRVLQRVQRARRERYRQLKGFYLGAGANVTHEATRHPQQRHAVKLTLHARAVGRTLSDLDLEHLGVEIVSLRRGENEFEYPSRTDPLRFGDTLILMGFPEDVEAAEDRLLAGRRKRSLPPETEDG